MVVDHDSPTPISSRFYLGEGVASSGFVTAEIKVGDMSA